MPVRDNVGFTDTSDATAIASEILAPKTAYLADGEKHTGTMPNRGAWTGSTSGRGSITIPEGYHNGEGSVSGADSYDAGEAAGVAATKVGTAVAAEVLAGKTFTNSSQVGAPGTMPNNGTWSQTITPSASQEQVIVIPGGYHSGSGQIIVSEYNCTNTLCTSACYPDTLCTPTCYEDTPLCYCGGDTSCPGTDTQCAYDCGCSLPDEGCGYSVSGCGNCTALCSCPAETCTT